MLSVVSSKFGAILCEFSIATFISFFFSQSGVVAFYTKFLVSNC